MSRGILELSFGLSVRTSSVSRLEVDGLSGLRKHLLKHPSTMNGGPYICAAPMRKGKRGAANSKDSRLLVADVDRLKRDDVEKLNQGLRQLGVESLVWRTRSSTKWHPRRRIVIALDQPVGRERLAQLHREFSSALSASAGIRIEFDSSSSRPEQPQFTPIAGRKVTHIKGRPYRVNSTEHVNHDPLAKVGTIDLQHSEHRNVDFTSLAGSMRRRGLPADHIHDALSAINKRLKRPLPSREIRAIAASIGNKPTSITPAIKLSSAFELVSDQSAPQWLLRPYLEQNVVAVLTGDFGTFKSFLALDWALHIAAGKPWHNDPSQSIPQHAVVFISAEGRGLSQRIRAWITHHFPNEPLKRVARRLKFRALEAPINLSELEQIDLLRNAIDALGVSPVLLIIDTLAKNSRDVEETNAKMQTFLNNINEHIRAPYKCTILLIHHVGHNKLRARGPSTLIASTDASFMVEKIDRWNIRLINERLKDSDSAPPLNLQAREISLGANGESDKVTSLVLVSGDKPIHIRRRPSSQTQIELLTRLESESKRSGVKSWTTQELNEIGRACIADRRRLLEARNGLRKAGWLSQREDKWLLMT